MKKTTTVINLLGGPGSGKSTQAAAVFASLKKTGIMCELVQEYVKSWAWMGIPVQTPFDQLYIFGKQARAESILYGKVDVIVTDSPVLLSAFYDEKHNHRTIVKDALPEFYRAVREMRVEHLNAFLPRSKPYDPRGRYQTEEEAKEVDVELQEWLRVNGFAFSSFPEECENERTNALVRMVS
jgi:nicotinamide riboside kinase